MNLQNFLISCFALHGIIMIIFFWYYFFYIKHKNIKEGMWWGPAYFRPGRGYPPYTAPLIFQEN